MIDMKKNLLLLLNDGGAEPAAAPAPQPQQSFTERKAAQLREERAGEPDQEPVAPPPPQGRDATPPMEMESEQIDGEPDLPSDEGLYEDEGDDLDPDGTLEGDAELEAQDPTTDWEKRFNDTRAELTRVQEDRKERDTEHANLMEGTLRLQHDLEDRFQAAEQSASFFANGFNQQIVQLEQMFNSGQIPPDELPAARQQYQQLVGNRNAMQQQLEQAKTQQAEAAAMRRKREAEVTRVRLQSTIPGWSREKHAEMREFASGRGFTEEEFGKITDYRMFELMHDSMQLHGASQTVNNIERKRKAKPPRARGQRQPRDSQGKYRKAQKDFHENPNQKGRFADMKAQELARERRGR